MNIIKRAFKEWYADLESQPQTELSWNTLLEVPIIVYVAAIIVFIALI